MKKDKLYTVSKYSADRINKEAKANLFFGGGGLFYPFYSSINPPAIFTNNSRIDYANSLNNTPSYNVDLNNSRADYSDALLSGEISLGSGTGSYVGSRPQFDFDHNWDKLDAAAGFSNVPPSLGGYTEEQLGVDLSKDRKYPNPPNHWGGNNNTMLKSILGGVGGIAGQLGNKLISNGYATDSGVGNGITNVGGAVGSAISKVNPLIGTIVTVGSGVLGGIVNRGFGVQKSLRLSLRPLCGPGRA